MVSSENKTGERPTIHAVAERAGVSPTTVSLVLGGKGGARRISEDTHRRVQKAAEELNYAPNLATRSLRGERSNIVSFFSSYRNRDRGDLYMKSLSSSVEEAGGACGFDILVHCNFSRSTQETYRFLNGGLADGLLFLAPTAEDPLLKMLRKSHLPIVFLNSRDPLDQYSSIADDVEMGMRLIAENLVAEGHRDIAIFVDEQADNPDCNHRTELLRSNLAEHGISVDAGRIINLTETEALSVMERVMSEEQVPTAIFCWHDRLAYAVLSACEALGISVPDDMSIVGYDGLHWPSRSSHIVASAVVSMDELAASAMQLLRRSIMEPTSKPVHQNLAVSFNRGTSLGPARARN